MHTNLNHDEQALLKRLPAEVCSKLQSLVLLSQRVIDVFEVIQFIHQFLKIAVFCLKTHCPAANQWTPPEKKLYRTMVLYFHIAEYLYY